MTIVNKKRDINIFAVVHDDIPATTTTSIYAEHFQPFVKELESFIDRKFNVVFGRGAPYSQFNYKGDDPLRTLKSWEILGRQYLELAKAEGFETGPLDQVVLLTKENLNERTGGLHCYGLHSIPETLQSLLSAAGSLWVMKSVTCWAPDMKIRKFNTTAGGVKRT